MSDLALRRQWLIAAGLSLAPGLTNGLARFAYGLVLPAMKQDLGWTYAQAGWINTANAIGYVVGSLIALRWVAKLGPQRLFVGGLMLTTLALFASGFTRDLWLFSLYRILAGIGGAPAFIAGGAMISRLFRGDSARNSAAIAVYFGGGGMGMLVSGLSLPFWLARYGASAWPVTWLMMGGFCLVGTPFAVWAALSAPHASVLDPLAPAPPLPLARMRPALLAYFLFGVGYIVYLTFFVAWMRERGVTPAIVAATWGTLGAAVMLSPLPWRGVLARSGGGGALALSCAATALGAGLPIVVNGVAGFLLSAAIFGVSIFIAPAAVTAFGRKNLPEAQWGRSVALFTTVFAVGQTLGPVAAGILVDAADSLTSGLIAAALVLALAGAVASRQGALRQV